jgi:hypothetical protein
MQEQLPREVFEEPTGMYLRRVSEAGTRAAARSKKNLLASAAETPFRNQQSQQPQGADLHHPHCRPSFCSSNQAFNGAK